jgi:hypothetical protein
MLTGIFIFGIPRSTGFSSLSGSPVLHQNCLTKNFMRHESVNYVFSKRGQSKSKDRQDSCLHENLLQASKD